MRAKLPEFEPNLSFEEQGLNEKTSLKRDVFSTMLPILDEFRTLNWQKIESDLKYFSNIIMLLQKR